MTATANCAASHEKLSSFVFSHIMFLKNDDVNAGNVNWDQGVSSVAFPLNSKQRYPTYIGPVHSEFNGNATPMMI